MISSFVFPEIIIPSSIAIYAATNAPSGSPGPASTRLPSTRIVPASIFDANAPIIPATAAETVTSCCASSFLATPTPIPAPVSPAATFPTT